MALNELTIVTEVNELNDLLPTLTTLFLNNTKVHFNKINHSATCTHYSAMMRNNQHPSIKIIYISPNMQQAVRLVLQQLQQDLPPDNNDDDDDDDADGLDDHDVIFMCPLCGRTFADQ